ncbi:SigE family RNA polymerase sigma factor [Myceligenerans salitolerans]|uniref:SigE family RNA polymerase sigma factor n=1 Tax=Myceligenerans salitolerans TaxID=1230528 RepID=UPI0027DB7985|nr:SigE family RNA polymerase sigma factor [Myceligenerans salitolerans]
MTSSRVAVRTTGGKAARFTAFAERTTPALSRLAFLLTGDEHRARDLVQQALERTYLAWGRVADGNPEAYARRIVVNARIDGWRKRRRETPADPAELWDAQISDQTSGVLHRDQLVRALRTLPPAQRRVIVLRYLYDLSEADTAAELGVSAGSVKSAASRGLARLRTVLGDESSPESTTQRKGTAR